MLPGAGWIQEDSGAYPEPRNEAGGVGVSAASWPYGSYCPPFTRPRSRRQLGQEKEVAESQSLVPEPGHLSRASPAG